MVPVYAMRTIRFIVNYRRRTRLASLTLSLQLSKSAERSPTGWFGYEMVNQNPACGSQAAAAAAAGTDRLLGSSCKSLKVQGTDSAMAGGVEFEKRILATAFSSGSEKWERGTV